jgi:hypothetical protein
MKTLTATRSKKDNGMWFFTCPLHEPNEHHFREPSNIHLAIDTLKSHMDERHPGIKARLQINGEYTIHSTYTATTVITPTGDIL